MALSLMKGLGLGAGLMYFLDPERGTRRRALMRDQFVHLSHAFDDFFGKARRDLNHRIEGLVAEVGTAIRGEPEPDDAVLVQRVRSKLGRVVSHPRAIDVKAWHGRVILRGPILANEVEHLIQGVSCVRGVREVENHLDVHREAEDISGLQGGTRRHGQRPEFLQEHWSPAARLVAGAAGAAIALRLLAGRRVAGLTAGAIGLGLVASTLSEHSTPSARRRRGAEHLPMPRRFAPGSWPEDTRARMDDQRLAEATRPPSHPTGPPASPPPPLA